MKHINLPITNMHYLNTPIWIKELYLRNNVSMIYSQPFTPFIILSADHDEVFYFTQTFAQLSGINPSACVINNKTLSSLYPNLYSTPLGACKIFFSSVPQTLASVVDSWVDDLTYELRTGSLLMDLSHHIMGSVKRLDQKLVQRFSRAAYRQKILTIIVSDLIQLLLSPPNFFPVSLSEVLRTCFGYLRNSSKTQFNLISSSSTDDYETFDPEIWGSSHYPENIFSTLLTWLQGVPITLEVEIINKFSVGISFNVLDHFLLTTTQDFPLVTQYLRFFTSYFNCRLWMTQNSINIILPIVPSK